MVFLFLKKYIPKKFEKIQMFGCRSISTPLAVNEKLMKEYGRKKVNAIFYRSLAGNLLYLPGTRPNIMFSTSLLSRFMHSPSHIYLLQKRF